MGVGDGLGDGVGVACGVAAGVAVGNAVGLGLGIDVGADTLVGVGVGTEAGFVSGVGAGLCSGVAGGDGGLTTPILTITVALEPAASMALNSNVAIPSDNGVMERASPSMVAEATPDSSPEPMSKFKGSVKNSPRSRVVESSPAVNSNRRFSWMQ